MSTSQRNTGDSTESLGGFDRVEINRTVSGYSVKGYNRTPNGLEKDCTLLKPSIKLNGVRIGTTRDELVLSGNVEIRQAPSEACIEI